MKKFNMQICLDRLCSLEDQAEGNTAQNHGFQLKCCV